MKKILSLAAIFAASISFSQKVDMSIFGDMGPREIGPAGMSGRVTCIDVVESQPNTIYIGAASGGVWVTTESQKIYAENETLTGSIGVYGIIPTLDGIYDWAGISVDGISSTKAGEWDPRLNMPQDVKSSIQASIDEVYKKFVTKVSENRDMSYEEVHKFWYRSIL